MRDLVQTVLFTLVNGSIYGLFALGVVLVHRGSRALFFAGGEVGVMALFVAWTVDTQLHLPRVLGALLAVAVAVLVGVLFERLVVSRMGSAPRVTVSVATVGLLLLILSLELPFAAGKPYQVAASVDGAAFTVANVVISWNQLMALAIGLGLASGLGFLLRRTDLGLALLAAADDAPAVRLVGVRAWHVSALTWGGATGLAAVAALLVEPTLVTFSPGSLNELYLYGLAAAIVGGLGSLEGAFVGGMVVAFTETVAKTYLSRAFTDVSGLSTAAVFALLLVVLLARPAGLLVKAAR